MNDDRQMWTPLETALAPFKDLARINRHTVRDADGRDRPLLLSADRCHVRPAPPGTSWDSATVELGFSLGQDAYAVYFVGANYRRRGNWDYSLIKQDISTGLQSGSLKPGTAFDLRESSRARKEGDPRMPGAG